VTNFLDQLNNRCDKDTTVACTVDSDCAVPAGACGFAGHRDWRLPAVKELNSIVDYSVAVPGPTVNAAFHGASCGGTCTDITNPACSCTVPDVYWSATTYANFPDGAWNVSYYLGNMYAGYKYDAAFARAVRAGS
jgi:hypothetical protein